MNNDLQKILDPKFYLESFCKIKTKEGKLAPFLLNEAQKHLYNKIKNNNRIIILKARQMGFSTGVTGYFYHYAITHPGTNAALIGYNTKIVAELLDKVKKAAYHLGMAFQVADDLGDILQDGKKEVEINMVSVIGKEKTYSFFLEEMEQFENNLKTLAIYTPSFQKLSDQLRLQAAQVMGYSES